MSTTKMVEWNQKHLKESGSSVELIYRRTYNNDFIIEHYDIDGTTHDIYIRSDETGVYKVTKVNLVEVYKIKIMEHEGDKLGKFNNEGGR